MTGFSVDAVRDAVNRQVFALGQRVLPHLSPGSIRGWSALMGTLAARVGTAHIDQGMANLTCVLGTAPTPRLREESVRSWARMFVEVLALPGWDAPTLQRLVTAEPEGERRLRAAMATTGAVIALPHMANWDLAGAWACVSGLPVTTVAEHLGEKEFASYRELRGRLGMDVFAHDDRGVIAGLVAAVRSGRVVCLMADRDLTGAGLRVDFGGHLASLPAGPALVARRTGAALIPMVPHYTSEGMALEFGPTLHPGPGRDGLQQTTQAVADFFVACIREHPADWQVMQPFFLDGPDPVV